MENKKLRLPSGKTIDFYGYAFESGITFTFLDTNVSDVRDFFGSEIIDYIDIIKDDNIVLSKQISSKLKNIIVENKDISIVENRIVNESYIEIIEHDDGYIEEIMHPEIQEPITRYETHVVVTVYLDKPSISEEIDSIKNVIGIVNPNNMTLDEFKKYQKAVIGKQCEEIIGNGVDVDINGDTKHFSYEFRDQLDFHDLMFCAILGDFSLMLPWHSDGNLCETYSSIDILKIYIALTTNKMYYTTYCNILNDMINKSNDINSIKNITFGMNVPEKYQSRLNSILNASEVIISSISAKLSSEVK